MDQMLPEIITHIMGFLSLPDRKEASLVCKRWYNASLHPCLQKDVIMRCRPPQGKNFKVSSLMGRKITHLTLGDAVSSNLNEDNLVTLLSQCSGLIGLDLSGCNSIFLSGRLLSCEEDRVQLQDTLKNVQELKLSRLRHMTDVTFTRLTSILGNLSAIHLASTNIIFGSTHSNSRPCSPAVFYFSTFVNFVKSRVSHLKTIELSHTTVNDQALKDLSKISDLVLDEIMLSGCMELTDKGIKFLAQSQVHLKKLDLSGCKELGSSKAFFSTLVQNLHQLQTLMLRKCPKIGQCDIGSLRNLSSLRTLDIGEALNLYDVDLIKGLCCPSLALSSISMAYCPDVCDNFVAALCEASPGLKSLDLTACNRITDASVHAISRKLLSLQSLRLAYCHQLTDLGILGFLPEDGTTYHHSFEFDHDSCCCMREKESRIFRKPTGTLKNHKSYICKVQSHLESGDVLYNLSNLTCLQTLDLSSCSRMTDLGITEAIQFKNLRNLALNNLPKLSDKSIQHIVRTCPSLEIFGLRGCALVTDVSVQAMATHSPCLESLDISQNDKLSDGTVTFLLARCRRLRHLDISFCGHVCLATVTQLESQYPKVKFHFRPHMYI